MQFQPRSGRTPGQSLRKKPQTAARREPAMLDAAATTALFSAAKEAAYVWNIETDALAWSANACDVLAVDSLAQAQNGKSFAALLHADSSANRYDTIVDSLRARRGRGRCLRALLQAQYRIPLRPLWMKRSSATGSSAPTAGPRAPRA